jgi:hypothetical protein
LLFKVLLTPTELREKQIPYLLANVTPNCGKGARRHKSPFCDVLNTGQSISPYFGQLAFLC